MLTFQNEFVEFPTMSEYSSITSKNTKYALDIDAIYNLKLRKT
jgi:hypothetical protein